MSTPAIDAAVRVLILTAVSPDGKPNIRWREVGRVFKCGRGKAVALCRRMKIDPFVWVPRTPGPGQPV